MLPRLLLLWEVVYLRGKGLARGSQVFLVVNWWGTPALRCRQTQAEKTQPLGLDGSEVKSQGLAGSVTWAESLSLTCEMGI